MRLFAAFLTFAVLFGCGSAPAAVLVTSPNGTYVTRTTLAAAISDPASAGKTVIVTSALTAVQSNISSATVHAWPTDRALKFVHGGSLGNTTTFRYSGDTSTWPEARVFAGTGTVSGLKESKPEWWGAKGDGTTDDSAAFNKMPGSTHVIISGKTYILESWALKSGSIYRGLPNNLLKLKPGSTAKNLAEGSYLTDIEFDHVNFDGNSANVTAGYSSPYLEAMTFMYGCKNVRFRYCKFTNYLSYGIIFNGDVSNINENVLVEKSTFTNGGKGGVAVIRYGANVKYLNNYLYNSTSNVNGVNFHKPLAMSGVIDGEIAGNTVIQDNGHGGEVIVEYQDRQSENIRVHNNFIKGQGWGSNIKIAASVRVSVYENDLVSPHYANVYVEGCYNSTVNNNRMAGAGINAIITTQDAQTLRNNLNLILSGNIIKDANRLGGSVGRALATVWSEGLTVAAEQVVYYGNNTYLALGAGVTGATAPVHSSGDVSDGTVTWRFLTSNASATASVDSYAIRIGSADRVYLENNSYHQDDLTMVANGVLIAATNYTVRDNDFSDLSSGVVTIDNHFSSPSTYAEVVSNKGFQTTATGIATILAGQTSVTVTPGTIVAEGANLVIQVTPKEALNGTVAYLYAAGATPPSIAIHAKNASHGAPTVSADIDVSWSISATDANGVFGKTSK